MDRESLEKLLVNSHPLSDNCDLAFTVEILKIYKPKFILELGAGDGDWITFIANALQDSSISFVGYEDFRWKHTDEWQTNISSLNEKIKNKLLSINLSNNIILKDIDITTIDPNYEYQNQLFDIVRLDCLATDEPIIKKVIADVIPYTHKNTIFLVDDITVNYCPNRFFAMMHLSQEGKLKPLWFGSKEGAWVHPDFDFEKFKLHIETKMNTHWYSADFYNYPMLGKQYHFISTRMHHR
jgi:hypothetical protein